MNILITGAGGFIGKNLLLELAPENKILALDRAGGLDEFIRGRGLENVSAATVDLNDPPALEKLAREHGGEWEAVIYLAGNGDPAYSVTHPAADLTDTVLGLLNFFRYFRADKFIYFSSGAVYDGISGPVSPRSSLDPRLPYAIGKLANEQYVKFFKKSGRIGDYIILRFFGAYGPFEPPRKIYTRLVTNFALEKNPEFTIRGDGKNLIDAMFVGDAVRAVRAVLESGVEDRVVDFCLGKPYTIEELVREAARIFEIEPRIKMEGEVPEYIDFRPSPREMEELFNFTPRVPLSEGLPLLARYLEEEA
jgi:UDP-glucose 4-epimerase